MRKIFISRAAAVALVCALMLLIASLNVILPSLPADSNKHRAIRTFSNQAEDQATFNLTDLFNAQVC